MADDILVVGTGALRVGGSGIQPEKQDPGVAFLSNGNYVVAWTERIYDPSTFTNTYETYFRIYDSAGVEVTTAQLQADSPAGEETQLRIIGQDTGGFVIIWNSEGQDGDEGGVFGQRFFNGGAKRGAEFQVNTTTTGDQNNQEIVAKSGGGYIVFWTEVEDLGGLFESRILYQEYDSSGNTVGSETVFLNESSGVGSFGGAGIGHFELHGTELVGGEIALTYTRSTTVGGPPRTDAYVKLIDASGNIVAGETDVDASSDATLPDQRVAALGNGNMMIVIQETSPGTTGAVGVGGTKIFVRIVDNTGVPQGGDIAIVDDFDYRRFDREIVPDGQGGAVLVYREELGTISSRILMQQIDEDGVPQGEVIEITDPTNFFDGRRLRDVATNDDGDIVAVWQNSLTGRELYHQVIYNGEDNRFTTGDDTVTLGSGGEVVIALAGQDTVTGGDGNDVIAGQHNPDSITGEGGNDRIYGGQGADTLRGKAGDDYLEGGSGADEIHGGADNDTVIGGDSNDLLYGGDNNDTMYGGEGTNTLYGGDGDDSLWGQFGETEAAGTHVFYGGDGNDRIIGGDGVDTLDGGDGNDIIRGGDFGTMSADVYIVSAGSDTYYAYSEADVIDYSAWGTAIATSTVTSGLTYTSISVYKDNGNTFGVRDRLFQVEELIGTDFADTLYSDNDSETIRGGSGTDTLYGVDGADKLFGQDDSDLMYGGVGADELTGGGDNDTLFGDAGGDSLVGGRGDDTLRGGGAQDKADGGRGDDTLYGQGGNDTLLGDNGEDTIYGGDNADVIYGGDNGDDIRGDAGADDIFGEDGGDEIRGGNGNDELFGGAGSDEVRGGRGSDTIEGGIGNDTLWGDEERDIFLFQSGTDTGTDEIRDFDNGDDLIRLVGSVEYGDLTITGGGGETVISWDTNTIVLVGESGVINENDFEFV
ncbi:MAG: calcium-binding protein [Pseudomonadota bacterium]